MIILGTKKEMHRISNFDEAMKKDVEAMLNILDLNYGEKRNYLSTGGFVSIVVTGGDFQKLFLDWKIDLKNEPCEYTLRVGGYIKKLFITEPDFAIVVYVREEML